MSAPPGDKTEDPRLHLLVFRCQAGDEHAFASGLALLIAALTTVGVYLRFRTAAPGEIQQRLEALEAMLSARIDAN